LRYAVLSDVHGNLEALTAVLEAADESGADALLCLGDLVGYGPDPNEVVELVRARGATAVRGNHDEAAIQPGRETRFNAWGQDAIRWSRRRLTGENHEYLGALPLAAVVDGVLLVHACASEPDTWRYILDLDEAAVEFTAFKERLCLFGHSHIPLAVESAGRRTSVLEGDRVIFEDGKRYMVNVGSVGQPRDGDPRAAFGLLDLDLGTLLIRRVEYDAAATRAKIIDAGLPVFLGDRLLKGR